MSSNEHKRPQLTSEELLQLKWLLGGALTLLALGTIFYMDVQAWTLMAITAGATVATLVRPELPARVPPLAHTLAFPAIVAFFAADLWLSGEVLPAMVRLDILLLLYRNITYRQRRDDLQIVVLGLFLVVVAGVLTVSLTFAVHLLIYTACALALLLVITLMEGGDSGRASQGERASERRRVKDNAPYIPSWAAHVDWPALLRRLRAVADWRVLGLGAVLFAGVVAVSALLFLAIPRFQLESGMFLERLISKKAKSGFSDSISFGDVTEIQQDESVALSVDVSDQTQIPASPYWRMLTLDSYEKGTFRLSTLLRSQEFLPERGYISLRGGAKPQRAGDAVWTFYLESGVSRYLPLLGHFETLRFRETQNFRLAPRLAIVALREEPPTMTAYQVSGFELSGVIEDRTFAELWRKRGEPNAPRAALQNQLRMSEADQQRLRGVVERLTRGETIPAGEFARRAGEWLRQQHAYSLSPTIPRGDGDPLVRWLMSREAGHCELFAGSFVVLARTAGYPARVVTGFRGGSWNGYSNNFTIRNADAHAWAEIFDEATSSWVRTDPLAPAVESETTEVRGEAAIGARLDRSWKARLDSLRVFWYRRIVSFDQRSQIETLKAVKEATQNTGRRLREAVTKMMADTKAWLLSPWDVRRIASVLGFFMAVAALVWAWRRLARRWWRGLARRRGPQRDDPVRREAGRWLERLEEGPTSKDHEPSTGEAGAVVAELLRLRYGAPKTWGDPEKIFRRARQAVRAARRTERLTRP